MILNVETFRDIPYCTWNIDLKPLKECVEFNQELNDGFLKSSKQPRKPSESRGNAYSVRVSEFKTVSKFIDVISPSLHSVLKHFNRPSNNHLVKCWANRMHKDSHGMVHIHGDDTVKDINVLIVYYNIPPNSGNLVLVDPKHRNVSELIFDEDIPEEDKKIIEVSEGLCVLHDCRLPHGVSKHNADEHRDSIIIEFKNYY